MSRKVKEDTSISKTLSWLLRHGAVKEGLTIGSDGFVDVSEILQHKSLRGRCNIEDIERIVADNKKQRFTLRTEPHLQIRANQGHSIPVVTDLELTTIEQTDDLVVIHGTYYRNWNSIKCNGLSRMNRQHIHFSPGELGDAQVVSGMRSSCQIYIYVDVHQALADGIKFYRSSNNVILSPGDSRGYIGTKYFTKVVDVTS
ncbi:hypothetical protein L9F63_006043, partial [Diploptera punctata]